MPSIRAALPAHQRLTLTYDGAPPSTAPSNFVLLRNGAAREQVVTVWALGPLALELALESPLVSGVAYVIQDTAAGAQADFLYRTAPPPPPAFVGDPADEAYGVDVDWLSPRTPRGDLRAVRGEQALRHDLAALAHLSPGELPHRPEAGLGLVERVNGTDPDELGPLVEAGYRADPRVATVACTIFVEPAKGRVQLRTVLTTRAFPDDNLSLSTAIP